MALDRYRRRRVARTIRELMKRGVDDPRTVPIPVPDTTPGAPDPFQRASFGIEASSSATFVGRSKVRASTAISGSSQVEFTNLSQGYVATWTGSTNVRFTSKARKVSTLSTTGATSTVTFNSSSSTTINRLLMESGDYVLQETNDRIILESTSQNAVIMETGSYVLKQDGGRITLESYEELSAGTPLLDTDGAIITDASGNTIFGV